MKRPLPLPGIKLPAPRERGGAEKTWPPIAELMGAVAECDLPPSATAVFPETAELPPIVVLGLGLGNEDPSLLSARDSRLLETSDVLAAGSVLLARFARREAEKIPLRAPLEEALEVLLERRRAGKRVTVLANGDPLFFGIGATLARLLPPEALRVLPGVGSLQEACARALLPWHDVISVSLHGRNGFAQLAVAALAGKPICLLTDAGNTPADAARFLLDRGVDWCEALVFKNMRGEDEHFHACSLAEAANIDFGSPCTVLFVPNAPPRRARLGLPDPEPGVEENGALARGFVRAAALAALGIAPRHLVWVLGDGSGATALEASALAHKGGVFAVEQDPARVAQMEELRRRHGAANMEILHADAPARLDDLPDPDAVFLGDGDGGEEHGGPPLEAAGARLKKGGRLVVVRASLENPERVRAAFDKLGLRCEITRLQLSEIAPPDGEPRPATLDAAFLIAGAK